MTCHIYSSWLSSSVPWTTIGCDQNTTWTTQHKTTQCLESVLNASTDKRLLVPNRSRRWNCLSHQWCTPFNMNWQTNGNLCCIYPLLHFFPSNTIAFWPWAKASANKWSPPPQKWTICVCAPAPVIKVLADHELTIKQVAQSRRVQAMDGIMQTVDFCQSRNMPMIRSLHPPWHSPPFPLWVHRVTSWGSNLLGAAPCIQYFSIYPVLSYIVMYHQAACLQSSGVGPLCVDSVPISLICSKCSVFHCQMRSWCLYVVIH